MSQKCPSGQLRRALAVIEDQAAMLDAAQLHTVLAALDTAAEQLEDKASGWV